MPEGDTVWNTAHALDQALRGRQLTKSDFRVPQLATTDLAGWTVLESTCRGKHLLLRLASPDGARQGTLHSHLRMDGSWRVYGPGQSRQSHQIRVVLYTDTATAVGYHLHDLTLVPTEQEASLVGHLGPDLLGDDWDPAEAARRIRANPDATIAEALLDQRNLAGIGNMYKCELLYLRGVNPWTRVSEVDDLEAMAKLAHKLLVANRGRWTQSTTGSLRRGETTHVYGRRAAPCRRCGTAIAKQEQGDRVTYWCPRCQPGQVH